MAFMTTHNSDCHELLRAFGLDTNGLVSVTIKFKMNNPVTIETESYLSMPAQRLQDVKTLLRRYKLEEFCKEFTPGERTIQPWVVLCDDFARGI